MNLNLNLASSRRPPSWAGWLLLILGAGMAAWAGWRYDRVGADLEVQRSRLATFVPNTARHAPARSEADKESPSAAQGRTLLATDWQGLLAGLEQSRPRSIALLSMEADAGGGTLNLTAEAKDHKSMLDYVRALNGQAGLEQVVLTSHNDVEQDGEKAVDFVVRVRWRKP